MDRFDLITKLAAVEAVESCGATAGERDAAARARERLEQQLDQLGDDRPLMPQAFAEELEAGHHLRDAPDGTIEDAEAPDRVELRIRLQAWRDGRLDGEQLSRWAARQVDRVVLPDLPHADPGSIAPEVLMVLAGGPPSDAVATAMLEFLDAGAGDTVAAWVVWLDALAESSSSS